MLVGDGWGALKNGLLMEEPSPILNMDAVQRKDLPVRSAEALESDPVHSVQASKVSFQILDIKLAALLMPQS